MKKKLLTLCLCGLTAASLAACGNNSTNRTATRYPLTFTSNLEDSVTEMPKICYTTPAEENGLGGNVYSVTGTVDEILSEEDSPSSTEMFSVVNENGTAWFGVMDPEFFSKTSGGDIEGFASLMDNTMDYTLPEVGEYVTVYGIYGGYSNVLEGASLYFGIDEFVYNLENNDYSEDKEAENSSAVSNNDGNSISDSLPLSVAFENEHIFLDEFSIYKSLSSDSATYNYYIYANYDISDLPYHLFLDLEDESTLEHDMSIFELSSNEKTIDNGKFDTVSAVISDDESNMSFYFVSTKNQENLEKNCDVRFDVSFPDMEFYDLSSIDIQDSYEMPSVLAEEFNNILNNSYKSEYKSEQITTKDVTPIPTPTPTPTPKPSVTSYGGGTLKVGTDIPAGEYLVLATDNDGGYFSVNSDANGDDIIFNENFGYNSIITIYNGEYLELSRARAYPFEEWCSQNSIDIDQEDATFKIGVNLPAGEYLLTATDEDGGYYCVYPDSRQQDIIANDNFEGQTYVTVSDGQYLMLSRCAISQ